MSSTVTLLQQAIKGRLDADSYIGGDPAVEVATEIQGDIANAIQRQLYEVGVGIVVMQARLRNPAPGVASVLWQDGDILVRIIENVLINRSTTGTGKPAMSVADAAQISLMASALPLDDGSRLVLTAETQEAAEGGSQDSPVLLYDLSFKFSDALVRHPIN